MNVNMTATDSRILRPLDPSLNDGRYEVVFVDSAVADYQTLVDSIHPGIEVVLIEGGQDGLAQMADWAENRTGYDAIHVVSHGSEGAVTLGSAVLNTQSLADYSVELASIGNALSTEGDILLYGCDVAAGPDGEAFVSALAHATGADVAASTDITGSADLGGDWVLESQTGIISTNEIPFDTGDFSGLLAQQTIDLGGAVTSGSLASGTFVIGGIQFVVTSDSGFSVSQSGGALVISENSATGDFSITMTETGSNPQFTAYRISFNNQSTGGDPGFGAQMSAAFYDGLYQKMSTSVITGSQTTYFDSAFGSGTTFIGDRIVITDLEINGYAERASITLDNFVVDLAATTLTAPTETVSTAALSADTGSSSTDWVTRTASQTISGTLSASLGAQNKVEVSYDNGSTWSDATSYSAGSTSWSTTTTLSGSNTFQARVTNTEGNSTAYTHTYTVDTTAPDAPSITSVTDNVGSITGTITDGGYTDDTSLVVRISLTGTGAVNGDSVQLYDSGSALGSAQTLTATNISNGYIDITTTLSSATTYVLTSRVIDIAGNSGTASSSHTVTVDTTAPTISTIDYSTPATPTTNADSLTYQVTFSEAVANIDTADFTVSGGTTATVSNVSFSSGTTYNVTVSGGDLASYNGTVTLGFSGSQNITDTVGNGLTATTPTGTNNVSYTVDNAAPSFTSSATPSVGENGTAVVTVAATDANGVSYAIVGGDDQAAFTINNSSGALSFNAAPDYESPTDTGTDNTYNLTVRATDAAGNSADQSIAVTVTNANEFPAGTDDSGSATEASGIANGTAGSNSTGNVITNDTDPDAATTLTVTAVRTGSSEGAGTVGTVGTGLAGSYGALTLNSDGSYSYAIDESNATVQALAPGGTITDSFNYTVSDGSLTDLAVLTITIHGANDAPSALSISSNGISTHDAADAVVGTLSTTDPDDSSWTYTIQSITDPSSGTVINDNSVFKLAGTGSVATNDLQAVSPSTLTPGTYTVTVRADDGHGGTFDQAILVIADDAFTVTTADDEPGGSNDYTTERGDGTGLSLREGISLMPGGNATIKFAPDINASTITLGGELAVPTGVLFDIDSLGTPASLTLAGSTLNLGGDTTFNGGTGDTFTISSGLTGSGSLLKTGTGSVTLSGNNTYTGTTVISGGTLTLSNGAAINNGSAVTLASGANLNLANNETIGSLAGAGNVTLGSSTLTVGTDNSSATFSGNLDGSGSFFKSGTGTLILSGNNSYTGTTALIDGTLSIAGDSNLGAGSIDFTGASNLDITGSGTIDNALTLSADGTINTGSGITAILSGVVSGTGNLTKTGAGTLVLNGNNTYSGTTTVSAGTLGGTGTLSAATIDTGTTLAPGIAGTNNGVGTLTMGNLTLSGTLAMQIAGTTAGTDYDQISIIGSVDLTGSTLSASLVNGFESQVGDSFILIDNDGNDAIIGTFDGIAEGRTFRIDGNRFQISYMGGDGNDVVLTDIVDRASSGGNVVVVDDGDNIVPAIEDAAPPLTVGSMTGDGNGDGVLDSTQSNVTSMVFLDTNQVSVNPNAAPVYITLVADSDNGKADWVGSDASTLSSVEQLDVPNDLPFGLYMPLGLISFTAQVTNSDLPMAFSLYVDENIQVNGYYKETSDGNWVNLASEAYGGKVVSEGDKTRLDFLIQDNGLFDSDPTLGVIKDPGGPGYFVDAPCAYTPFGPDADGDGMPDSVEASLGFDPTIKDNDIFGNNELFVRQLYRDIFGREGGGEEVNGWSSLLDSGDMSQNEVIESFINSSEFQSGGAVLARLYHGLLDRSPDYCGWNYWLDALRNGTTKLDLANAFIDSSEYLQSGNLDNTSFLTLLYNNILGRSPDAQGLAYWQTDLAQGMSQAELLYGFIDSAEFSQSTAGEVAIDILYLGLLGRTPDAEGYGYWESMWPSYANSADFYAAALGASEYHDRVLPTETEVVTLTGVAPTADTTYA